MPGYRTRPGGGKVPFGSHNPRSFGRANMGSVGKTGNLSLFNRASTQGNLFAGRGLPGMPTGSRTGLGGRIPTGGVVVHPNVQMLFFDRGIIRNNWDRINRDPLQRAANYVRVVARNSIKRRKKRASRTSPPSPPGTPPRSRWQGTTPPFKQIFAVPERSRMNFRHFVGMVGYNVNSGGELPVPGLHEHGGIAERYIWNPARRNMPQPRNSRGQFAPYPVRRRIHARVRYPARPFMWPALLKTRSKLPHLWKHSLTRGGASI